MRITAAATPPTTAAVNRPGGRASDSSPGSPPELATIAGEEWVGNGGKPSTTGTEFAKPMRGEEEI
jgi:hypothetical protein